MFFGFFIFFPLGEWPHPQEMIGLTSLINFGCPVVKTTMALGIKECDNVIVIVTTAFVEYLL